MGRTRFSCKVMLWPWLSKKPPKCCSRHGNSIWWSFLWNNFKIRLQITKLWARHDFASSSCCDLDLQGSDQNVAWSFLWNSYKIWLPITKLWTGHDFDARSCCDLDLQCINLNVAWDMSSHYGDHFCKIVLKSCCDLDLQGRDPNFARDTSSQYGDHFSEIVLKSDFKKQSYRPKTILILRSCCDFDL